MIPIVSSLDEIVGNEKITKHAFYSIQEIEKMLMRHCEAHNYKIILEIGPGHYRFPLSTHFVGHLSFSNEQLPNWFKIDIDCERLPTSRLISCTVAM